MPSRIGAHNATSRPLLAWACACALAVGGCSATVTQTPSAAGIAWTDCPRGVTDGLASAASALVGKLALACGSLDVPLDHDGPQGTRLTMRVIRVRANEQSNRIGSLVYIPGGPGASGLDYLPSLLSVLPASMLQRFDVVSFDPRGTGGSAPINCPRWPELPPGTPEPDLLSEAGFATASRLEQQYAQGCLQVLDERAPHFSTAATARDLDLLRSALGEDRLTYLGQSYGAKLGAEYARRFPDAVRVAVLDAPSEPGGTLVQDLIRQAKGFEDTFDVYAAGCSTRPACHLGRDPRAFVSRLVAKANKSPISSRSRVDTAPATGADVLDTVRGALYIDASWNDLDEVLYDASLGDSAGIFAVGRVVNWQQSADDAPSDPVDANYVINCNDSAPGPNADQLRAQVRRLLRDAPLFGPHTASALLNCRSWQPLRTPLAEPVAGTANPLLVIGTVHDAATPYAGAVALTRVLGNARLLTWEGSNHTSLAFSGCIADYVARYLIDVAVPPDGTRCPA